MAGLSIIPDIVDERRKRLRGGRFKDHLSSEGYIEEPEPSPKSPNRLKGVSNCIEKSYFRLTSAPKISQVRPLPVLKKSLQHVKTKYTEDEDYAYCCEQLKSIRQDLTVQNINNRFTAHVYETHGRVALECGDLCEYNQCQSRLQEMKKKGIQIAGEEFNFYRMLHAIYRSNSLELVGILKELSEAWNSDTDLDLVNFTLQLRSAMINRNDVKFFKLYQAAPHLGGYLIDYMLSPMRIRLYDAAIRSYDSVSFPFMMEKLNFSDSKECKEFLDSRQARYVEDAAIASLTASSSAATTASSSLKSQRKEKKRGGAGPLPPPAPVESLHINCKASRAAQLELAAV